MVPHAAPPQPAPATLHVTDVFEAPVTVTVNCCVVPSATVALVGLTFTATGPGGFVGLLELLLGFVKPAHPERARTSNRTTTRRRPNF
jgi:hypothetical protein